MIVQHLSDPESFAAWLTDSIGADPEIAARYSAYSNTSLSEGEPHNRGRGKKHTVMVGYHLNQEFIHVSEKILDHLIARGDLKPWYKKQDLWRLVFLDWVEKCRVKGNVAIS